MDVKLFEQFRQIIKRESGIHLTPDKIQLLSNRIQKRLRALNIGDAQKYLEIIESDLGTEELINLVDVVSTNVTFFNREPDHYDTLEEILRGDFQAGRKRFRIWCAASSSGEEPYNISMICNQAFGNNRVDVKILATDICTKVLAHAVRGQYMPDQLRQLPEGWEKKYFTKVDVDDHVMFEVKPDIREKVIFKKLNLATFPYKVPAPLDVIFCRNVMIYFDIPLRQQIINQFERLLRPGGYLFLSHSENLLGVKNDLSSHGFSVFRKDSGGGFEAE